MKNTWVTLQILRGIAASVVVFHHLPHFLVSKGLTTPFHFELGAIGVDVFFVLSGFVMYASTYYKENSPAQFFFKRLIRIVPIYWILSTFLFFSLLLFSDGGKDSGYLSIHYFSSLVFYPFYDSRGYIRPLLDQGWTLYFEFVFYAFVAFAFIWSRKNGALFGAGFLVIASSIAQYWGGSSLLGSPLQLLSAKRRKE